MNELAAVLSIVAIILGSLITLRFYFNTRRVGIKDFQESIDKRGKQTRTLNAFQRKWKSVMKGTETPQDRERLCSNIPLLGELSKELNVEMPSELDEGSVTILSILRLSDSDSISKHKVQNYINAIAKALDEDLNNLKASKANWRIAFRRGWGIRSRHNNGVSQPHHKTGSQNQSGINLLKVLAWIVELVANVVTIVLPFLKPSV